MEEGEKESAYTVLRTYPTAAKSSVRCRERRAARAIIINSFDLEHCGCTKPATIGRVVRAISFPVAC